jgi:hypothetical protein
MPMIDLLTIFHSPIREIIWRPILAYHYTAYNLVSGIPLPLE